MMDFSGLGKMLLVIGLLIAGLGLLFVLGGKGPFPWIGRLPGDFYFKSKNVSFYFPLATSLLVSVVLTLIIWFINRK
jgi:hypothetical protein